MPRRITARHLASFACAATVAASAGIAARAQGGRPSPAPDRDAMYQHLKQAQLIAGLDLYPYFAHRCLVDQTYRRTISRSIQADGAIEPLQVLDDLYFVGQNAATAWALRTSAGIVVFDALNDANEAKTYIVGGLVKLGLKPADIKYVVITHAHRDHFGGAAFLKAEYNATLLASAIDWDVMAKAAPAAGAPPRDREIKDGERLTVGDTVLQFRVTPGHTPGTVSSIFAANDRGRRHVVGFFGGLGTPGSAEDKRTHVASLAAFRADALAAGVDVLIANHQTQDLSLHKLELLRLRRDGDPNPYVIGNEAFVRYLDIQRECTLYALAREGQK
jgi:metallo-beta-lactamase class B